MSIEKVLIIEDEYHSREFLKGIIDRDAPNLKIVGEAESITDSIRLIQELNPDILLVDIQLKDGLSFEIFDHIDSTQFKIIFITSYDHFAIKAIKLSALEYVLKPVHIPELLGAFDKATKSTENIRNSSALDSNHIQHLMIRNQNRYIRLLFNEIYAVVADTSYAVIYTKSKRVISSQPLSYYVDILPSTFFQCHRSAIINCDKIKSVTVGRAGNVYMEQDLTFPVSARRKTELLSIIKKIK